MRRGALCQAQQRGARQLPDRPRAGVREPHDSRVAEDAHADGIGAGGDALDGRGPPSRTSRTDVVVRGGDP